VPFNAADFQRVLDALESEAVGSSRSWFRWAVTSRSDVPATRAGSAEFREYREPVAAVAVGASEPRGDPGKSRAPALILAV